MLHPDRARWLALLCAGALLACSGDDSGSGGAGPGPSSSSTTSSAGGGGGAGGSSSTGGGQAPIACDPGGYGNMPVGECDLLQQDCPPGQTCQPFQSFNGAWNTKCAGGTGLKGPGKTCLDQGECAAGLFCIGGEGSPSICTPVCCQESNEPCGGGQCQANVAYGPYYVLLCAYDPVCHLFDPSACDDNTECHVADADTGLATCTPPAPQQSDEGGPCTYINSCKHMQECYQAEQICRYYCLLEPPGPLAPGEGGCPAGQACTPENFGISGVGICQPMP